MRSHSICAFLASAVWISLATSAPRPNILLFFPDELRYDWGGLTNNPYYTHETLPLYTPHFDALAGNGTRFTRAFVGSPICAPSRACLASGRDYDQNTVPENFHNDFDVEHVETFYKVLRDDAGYHTMVAGRDDLDKSSSGPGIDGSKHTDALGFSDSARCAGSTDATDHGPHEPFGMWLKSQPVLNSTIAAKYNSSDLFDLQKKRFQEIRSDYYAIPDPMPLPDAAYQDNWIGERVLDLLRRRPLDKPFFLQASHQAPHPPMDITADMMAAHDLRNRRFPDAAMSTRDKATIAMGRQNYAAKIERLDYWLGRYKELLAEQGVLDNTVVCVASDHGEMLYDRSTTYKAKPWSSASSVPLFCSGPGIGVNAVSERAVSTVDLAPTFLDIAGVLHHAPPNMSRHSLFPALSGKNATPPRRVVRFGLDNFRGVVLHVNASCTLKFFCCAGSCPGSTPDDRAGFPAGVDEHHLFNIAADRFESPESDLRQVYPEIVRELAHLLPPPHQTAANPNATYPDQGKGYIWPGCQLDTLANAPLLV